MWAFLKIKQKALINFVIFINYLKIIIEKGSEGGSEEGKWIDVGIAKILQDLFVHQSQFEIYILLQNLYNSHMQITE